MTTLTLNDIYETAVQMSNLKVDFPSEDYMFEWYPLYKGVGLSPQERLYGTRTSPMYPNDWAWSQICARYGTALWPKSSRSLPSDYIQKIAEEFPELTANLLNEHHRRYKSGLFVRTYDGRVRAFLSDRYAAIDNVEVLEMALKAFEYLQASGVPAPEISSQYYHLTTDSLGVRITLKNFNTGDGDYGIGCFIGNDEVGRGRLRLAPYIQRHKCQNSAIFDEEAAVSRVHRGLSAVLAREFAAGILHAFKISADLLEMVLATRQLTLPNFTDVVARICKDKGWSENERDSILLGSEGEETVFGLFNGITAMARDMDDPDRRVETEILAGKLITNPQAFKLPRTLAPVEL